MKDTGEAGNALHENKAVKRFGHLIGLCNLAAFSHLWLPLSAAELLHPQLLLLTLVAQQRSNQAVGCQSVKACILSKALIRCFCCMAFVELLFFFFFFLY